MVDAIILLAIAAYCAYVVIRSRTRKGGGCCSGSCSGCSGCSAKSIDELIAKELGRNGR